MTVICLTFLSLEEHQHVAAFLVYVDDFLAARPRRVLLKVWRGSAPDFLGRESGDVDPLRFLGLDVELGHDLGIWFVHQPSYIDACLKEMCDFHRLKECPMLWPTKPSPNDLFWWQIKIH